LLTPQEQHFRISLNSGNPVSTSLAVQQTSSPNRSEFTNVGLPSHIQRYYQLEHQQPQQHLYPSAAGGNFTEQGNIQVMVHDGKTEAPFPVRGSSDIEGGNGGLRRSASKVTLPAGIGDRPNTGHDGGYDGQFDGDSQMEWGPDHPCYPHLNAHVPLSSPLYSSTRVIKVPRDWLIVGDLAPTFANVYPEVLEPVMSEVEFRNVVGHINEEVVAAFDPFGWRAWMDSILGVMTFWLWEDFGFTGVKSKLSRLEQWLERWNRDVGSKDGVQIIPLRRTAYMTVSDTLRHNNTDCN
jgi:Golgin subfamily A member 7/ERF4 family